MFLLFPIFILGFAWFSDFIVTITSKNWKVRENNILIRKFGNFGFPIILGVEMSFCGFFVMIKEDVLLYVFCFVVAGMHLLAVASNIKMNKKKVEG